MNAFTQSGPLMLPSSRRGMVNGFRRVAFLIMTALVAGQFVGKAQETNLVSQTNDVVQADDTATEASQNGDTLQEEQGSNTNTLSETNQTTPPGPDGRTRRQRRRAQNRPRENGLNAVP